MGLKEEILAYLAVEEEGSEEDIREAVGDYEHTDFEEVVEALEHERTIERTDDGNLKLSEFESKDSFDDEFEDLEEV